MQRTNKLKVHSIFESISGEGGGIPQGAWTKFIRLQGCNLNCNWCDTEQARGPDQGQPMLIQNIIKECNNRRNILITGGEPLMQEKSLCKLISPLLEKGRLVQIETNGSYAIPPKTFVEELPFIRSPIHWVVDYKTPSSGQHKSMPDLKNLTEQIAKARKCGDEVYIKWVVDDLVDLEFALDCIETLVYEYERITPYLISPLNGGLESGAKVIQDMAGEVLERRPNLLNYITFSVQLHKLFEMP